MTAGTSSAEGQSRPAPEADTPEPPALLVGGGDRCSNCGSTLAVDQRYCVECGSRRGKPRFALATAAVAASTETTPTTPASGGWSRLSAALAVIAVLLALGVGVLIGNSTQASLKQPVKVQITGGTLSSATSGTGSGATTTPASGGSGGSSTKSCAHGGAGCKNGKQTGNFFGGG